MKIQNKSILTNGKHLINGSKSRYNTGKNSPSANLSIDTGLRINRARESTSVLPVLHLRSPMHFDPVQNQTVNTTANKSLYNRGLRTPIKKYISPWDARMIEDSKKFFKEEQARKVQQKQDKHMFKEFLDNQVQQREQFNKANFEQNQMDFKRMLNNIDDVEK